MRWWQRYLGSIISSIYIIRQMLAPSPTGFRILMYHAIGSTVPDDVYGLYNLTPRRFKEQMQILSNIVAGGVSNLEERSQQGLAITFDDGYRDILDVVVPILMDLKIPFTVFVTPSFVLSGKPIYLSVSALRELVMIPGVSIGAHGYSHCRLTECNPHQLREELINSRKWLEDILGKPVTTMSYPHGAVNQSVRNAVANAGYLLAASSRVGTNLPGSDPLWLARTNIWAQDGPWSFRTKLSGGWDWLKFCLP